MRCRVRRPDPDGPRPCKQDGTAKTPGETMVSRRSEPGVVVGHKTDRLSRAVFAPNGDGVCDMHAQTEKAHGCSGGIHAGTVKTATAEVQGRDRDGHQVRDRRRDP